MSTDRRADGLTGLDADVLAARMRAAVERIVIAQGPQQGRLHVDDGDGEPLCGLPNTEISNPACKPLDVYPPGWRAWCPMCVVEQLDVDRYRLPEEVRADAA